MHVYFHNDRILRETSDGVYQAMEFWDTGNITLGRI